MNDPELQTFLSQEIISDGRNADEVREGIFEGYLRGAYTGTECFDWYDEFKLWPARKGEFWSIYFEGLKACREKDGLPNGPGSPQGGASALAVPPYHQEQVRAPEMPMRAGGVR